MVSSDLSTEGNIMKKIFILIIVFGLVFTAVYGNKQEKDEPEKWVIRYENGNKKIEFELRSGVKHGRAKWWHENGKIKITGLYKNDKREGKWTSWDPDGKKYSETVYKVGKIIKEDKILKAKIQSKPGLTVFTPEKFSKEKSYPLFIVLERGYVESNILKNIFQSKKITKHYILAFIRSSQVVEWGHYTWKENIPLGRKEIKQMYTQLIKQYAVDTDNVIIGGMSQDGMMSIDIALNKIILVRGFIVFCPTKPESFNDEKIEEALQRGLKGTIIAGENDSKWLPDAKEMAAIFKAFKFPNRFIIIPGMGHDLPKDSKEQIDAAIDHINLCQKSKGR